MYILQSHFYIEINNLYYLAAVTHHQADGQVRVSYPNGDSELLSLKSIRWCLTRKGGRHYLPLKASPPQYLLKKLREEARKVKFFQSYPHTVKAFADDLTVLSQRLVDHHEALLQVESCCSDLDLELQPDKCVTISYNGKQIVRDAKVKLLTGSTRSITSGSTKFLGHLLGNLSKLHAKQHLRRYGK